MIPLPVTMVVALIEQVQARHPGAELACNTAGNLVITVDGRMVGWIDFSDRSVQWYPGGAA